jgi:hypothetical protein
LHFINKIKERGQHFKKTKRKPLSRINNFVEVGPLLKNTSSVEKQQGTSLDMKVISQPNSPSLCNFWLDTFYWIVTCRKKQSHLEHEFCAQSKGT